MEGTTSWVNESFRMYFSILGGEDFRKKVYEMV